MSSLQKTARICKKTTNGDYYVPTYIFTTAQMEVDKMDDMSWKLHLAMFKPDKVALNNFVKGM